MNKEETRALWDKGEEAWNVWALALLQRKEALETGGTWLADWFGEGQNSDTQSWIADARADFTGTEFATDASFSNLVFPGPAAFEGAHFLGKSSFNKTRFAYLAQFQSVRFDGEAAFEEAQFYHLTSFDDAAFASAADFEKAEFLRESTGPLVPAVRFPKTQFASRAEFRGAKFTGHAEFIRTQFGGNARFDEAEFLAEANFEGTCFEGTAGLVKARFQGAAKFDKVHFGSDARFGESEFKGPVGFEETSFSGKTSFRMGKFGGETRFDGADFETDARFTEAQFADAAHFRKASFEGRTEFQKAAFAKTVEFSMSCFEGETDFGGASFAQAADFTQSQFKGNTSFSEAAFRGSAIFVQAQFKGRASFRRAHFAERASFEALQSKAAFGLAGSRFSQVPSFQEASFRETPNLDYIAIDDPVRIFPERAEGTRDPRPFFLRGMKACGRDDISARYRRLRQFASDAKDHEREREFFAQELRARRFFLDKPFGSGLGRFWFGWLYGGLSDFGRSFGRPLLAWALSIPFFALAYLAARRSDYFASAPTHTAAVPAASAPALPAFPQEANVHAVLEWLNASMQWGGATLRHLFSAGGCITGESGATAEAFFLSLKNAFFFLGWESQDAARRVYACLYGFEGAAADQLLRVPLAVSTMAIVQNIISAFLLFLVLIAFRNLLRTR